MSNTHAILAAWDMFEDAYPDASTERLMTQVCDYLNWKRNASDSHTGPELDHSDVAEALATRAV